MSVPEPSATQVLGVVANPMAFEPHVFVAHLILKKSNIKIAVFSVDTAATGFLLHFQHGLSYHSLRIEGISTPSVGSPSLTFG